MRSYVLLRKSKQVRGGSDAISGYETVKTVERTLQGKVEGRSRHHFQTAHWIGDAKL